MSTLGITRVLTKAFQEERSGSVLECLTWDRGVGGLSLNKGTVLGTWARHFILCLVLVQPRKTRPDMTEQMLTGMKASKQVKPIDYVAHVCVRSKCLLACYVVLHFFPYSLICDMTTFRKKYFYFFTQPKGSRMFVKAEYLLAWCSTLYSLKFDMQHDYFQKNIIFWPLDPTEGVREGKIFSSIMLYVSFPLIWYATWPYSDKIYFWYRLKVRKRAKIRNQYNQAPQLTQDTKRKVTTSQLDITN